MVFYLLFILITTKGITAQDDTNYLINFRGETLLSLKMDVNFNIASELCHKVLGGRFPVIQNERDIEDIDSIGLNNIFLEVKKANNIGKHPLLSERRTYEWSDGSNFTFHPWIQNYPNCIDYCCTVIYSTKRIYDSPCRRTLTNMVCILPDVKNVEDEVRKELVQTILESSSEEDVKIILDFSLALFHSFRRDNRYIKYREWSGQDIYYNQKQVTFFEAVAQCSDMGGQMPSVHSREEMNSLSKLVNNEPIYLGSYPVDNSGISSTPFDPTKIYTWQDNSTFEPLEWRRNWPDCREKCCYVALYDSALYDSVCSNKLRFVCIGPFSLNFKNEYIIHKSMMKLKKMNKNVSLSMQLLKNETLTMIQAQDEQLQLKLSTLENRTFTKIATEFQSSKSQVESLQNEIEEVKRNASLSSLLIKNETSLEIEAEIQSSQSRINSLQDEIKFDKIIFSTVFGIIISIFSGFLLYFYRSSNRYNHSFKNTRVLYKSEGENSFLSISPTN